MEKLKNEIHRVKRHNLEYYHSHLTLVESYIEEKPDISIETCKALIEGISKLILHKIEQEPLSSLDQERNLQKLYKKALAALDNQMVPMDISIARCLCNFVKDLGAIRNSHGDISHGRSSLKDQFNDADFAELVIGVTDNLCTYMLRRLDQLCETEVLYDENVDFNDFLDEQYSFPEGILYSKALFEQDLIRYEVLLGDYQLEKEQE